MDLLWPGSLILLGIIPVLLGVYIWAQRRRRRFTVRYSSLSLVRQALPRYSRWRQHLPFALFLIAIACLAGAVARPVSIVTVPTDQTTIILTLDVSGSMRAQDIEPSRLAAAEAAAISFIQRQKSRTQIGLVAFSGFAELVQPPTSDQEMLQAAVESLTTGRRTAVGTGIIKAINAIAEVDKLVAPGTDNNGDPVQVTPVPHGAYAPDIIVLLTDGVSNAGVPPLEAAQVAADRGIRIYTIGYGTPFGSITFGGQGPQGGGGGGFGGFPGGNGFGGTIRTGIDESTLKEVASLTGGEYYAATSAGELENVFRSLPTYLIAKHETIEISALFAIAGALLAGLALLLSMLWHPLP